MIEGIGKIKLKILHNAKGNVYLFTATSLTTYIRYFLCNIFDNVSSYKFSRYNVIENNLIFF